MALAVGRIEGIETVVLVQNFAFMGGSLGMAAGDVFLTACEQPRELTSLPANNFFQFGIIVLTVIFNKTGDFINTDIERLQHNTAQLQA